MLDPKTLQAATLQPVVFWKARNAAPPLP